MDMYEVKSKSLWLYRSLFLTTQKQNAFSCVEKLEKYIKFCNNKTFEPSRYNVTLNFLQEWLI